MITNITIEQTILFYANNKFFNKIIKAIPTTGIDELKQEIIYFFKN